MEYRILGKTNLKVSTIGIGTWAIGGNMWGPQKDTDSIEAINKALDLGVNFIDTALSYGNGHSEYIIGQTLKERGMKREEIIIASKIPPIKWAPPPGTPIEEAYPKSKIITSIEQSLRNLNMDYIDIIQMHSWRENWTHESEWYETMFDFKKQGKIRFIGISVHDNCEDEALGLIETGKVDTIQVVYNVLAQTPQKNLFPKALKHNVGIIARVPLAYGALTGKFTEDTTFASSDFRKNKYTGDTLKKLIKDIEEYKKIVGSDKKEDLIAAAMHFVLDHEAVSLTIPGIRNAKQATTNCTIFNENRKVDKEIIKKLYNFSLSSNHK